MVTRKRDEQNMGLEKEHVAEIRKKYNKNILILVLRNN